MTTSGIVGYYVETHNWGKAVAFWQEFGFVLEFETDHHSGQLVHPEGGPFVFTAERPEGHVLQTYPIIGVHDATTFSPGPPAEVQSPFEPQHWDVMEMMVRDADGHAVSLQAPLPEGVEAPAGHG
jgi:hypothetical protein